MTRRTRQALLIALPVLLVTLIGFGTLFATADAGATVFLPLIVRSPAVEEPAELLDHETRFAVIEDVNAFIDQLPHEDFEAETEAILNRLRSHPEIQTAVADDTGDTIYAIFTDGVVWYIFEKTYVPPPNQAAGEAGATFSGFPDGGPRGVYGSVARLSRDPLPSASPSAAALTSADGAGIPYDNTYLLMNGLGGVHDRSNPISDIETMLKAAGYEGEAREASVEELRRVGGVGVLYLRTHGIQKNELTGVPNALSTSTLYTAEAPCDLTAEDMAYGRLSLARATHRRWEGFRGRMDTLYAINHRFIRYYWSDFSEDSLVYLDACHGITFFDIITALRLRNVSVVFGWNLRVRPQTARDTSRFVFDRLLGANVFEPEDPPQRPFDYASVFAAHIGWNRDHGYCEDELSQLSARPRPEGGGFGLLAPSIKRMEIREGSEELIIHGLFGTDPGDGQRQVTIQGELLHVDKWTEREITVGSFTADKEGEVVVTVMERESNAVPITSWRHWEIRGISTWTPEYAESMNGHWTVELVWELDVRADVHSYREAPGAEPVKPEIDFWQAARPSTLRWTHGAYWNLPVVWCEIEDSDSLDWYDFEGRDISRHDLTLPLDHFGAGGSLNMETERVTVWAPYYRRGADTRCEDPWGDVGYDELEPVRGGTGNFSVETGELFPFEVTFDGYDIEGGDKTWSPEWLHTHNLELEWDGAPARSAPDPGRRH